MNEERLPYHLLEEDFTPYWFHENGEPFPTSRILVDWSNSTLGGLIAYSGGFLSEICNGCNEEMVRLNTPHIQEVINKMKLHIANKPPDICYPKQATPNILNMIATFDIMVERFGDDARFCVR
jgi:L-alanine-DL-glutamate epimerase-like enolase superfamily enzyme